jgi:hypothetical protein
MIDKLMGLRTFIFAILCLGALLLGLHLAKDSTFYSTLATAIGALMGAQVIKSVGTAAVSGEGVIPGIKNVFTNSKPGDPTP